MDCNESARPRDRDATLICLSWHPLLVRRLVNDGLNSTRPFNSLFKVLRTSGRPCPLALSILDVQRKLSHKDFSECFPLWCEEQPNGAEGVFKTVSSFIETHIIVRMPPSLPLSTLTLFSQSDTNKLFEQYDVQKQVDVLHGVVTDARAQRRQGETPGADRWREDLQPREAVRARTTVTLERERDLLRARLAKVRRPLYEIS